ncbi:reticulon-like protein B9 [Morus notabilis]|uniref:reticulon-like protein B9 n=1 Tax=Morus notabilis TaxID=981085 RepID=UPI000CECE818|nr:reticulon-like protein B9 [Morus notabilis]
MSIYPPSDSENDTTRHKRLFGRERPIHEVLGGGQVADVLLWRNRNISAALLAGMTVIWFLFEVVEYNFVTLLCHISITTMLAFFIWCTGAEIFKWTPPKIPQVILHESSFREVASTFHTRFNQSLSKLLYIACGRDVPLFLLVIVSLYILSVIGTCFSFLNFLYLGFVCMETLPFMYERFEDDVDRLAVRIIREIKRSYRRLDTNVLNKIPRGPVKEKKFK